VKKTAGFVNRHRHFRRGALESAIPADGKKSDGPKDSLGRPVGLHEP
jgi:hypothetical protein